MIVALLLGIAAGFISGLVVPKIPIAYWVNRFLARRIGPAEFKIGDDAFLLGPDDHLVWEPNERTEADKPKRRGRKSGRT